MALTGFTRPGGGVITVPLTAYDGDDDFLLAKATAKKIAGLGTGTGAGTSSGSGKKKAAAVQTGGGGGGGGGGSSASTPSDADVLKGYYELLKGTYAPETIDYQQKTEEELRAGIVEWLRPGYDAAIRRRQALTDEYHAELDADAIARGMGASTYVTDVKSRQKDTEAADILSLEAEYGAALAKYVSDAVEAERARSLEVELFNNQREHEVYLKAYERALTLFAEYKAKSGGGRSSGGSGASRSRSSGGSGGSSGGSGVSDVVPTTPENCERFVSGLSYQQKYDIMVGSSDLDKRYRAELIASVGENRYWELIAGK